MKKVFKIGIFGIGHFGRFHLQNLLEIDSVQVIGFCDSDPQKQKSIQKEFNIPFYSQSELIEKSDIIDIVTPTYTHFNIAKEALLAHKHVFVEKPFTQSLEEAHELIRLSEKTDKKFTVGLIERLNPVFSELEKRYTLKPKFIETQRIGPFNPNRNTDVPVIIELMIHDIDLVLHLMDSPIKHISASGAKVLSDKIDIVNARLEFENGTAANLTSSRIATEKVRRLRLFQENKYFSIDFIHQLAHIHEIQYEKNGDKNISQSQFTASPYNALKHELELFIKSIQNNTKPHITAKEALKALDVAIQIEKIILENEH